ncbi:MAG: VWA domain-containing protein [bacterium]|nr:VWA domain-containing protein [bacterium]
MRPAKYFLSALALVAAFPFSATAQERSAGTFEGEVSVNEVLLDVVVTDKNGNVILGLDRDDFIVEEEDGVVELTGSTFYSNRQLVDSSDVAATLKISPDEMPVDRYFILFLHDQRLAAPSLTTKYMDLARRAETWIRTELLPNDWVAVVRYDFKLKVYTDFTRDNEQLAQAIHDAARGKNPPEVWPSRLEERRSEGPSLLANLPQGKELRRQTKRLYSGLEILAEAAGNVVGRKNLLFFSAGFGEVTGFGTVLPDERYYDDMVHTLNDNNLAVYSISVLTGIDFAGQLLVNTRGVQDSMNVLAIDTGGEYLFNHVSFEAPLAAVLEENSGYYLLSYSSETPAGQSGYRKVEVRVKNPDLDVKAREGYRFGA